MKTWELFTLKDYKEWSALVDLCKQADIHFTLDYMKIFHRIVGGDPLLFVLKDTESKNFLLYPFFKRRINDLPLYSSLKEEYFDIISPWYFGGPLLHSNENRIDLLNHFIESFQIFARENNIITEFTRIHPLLESSTDFTTLTNGEYKYDVSYVDLKQPIENIWSNIKKSNRNAINAAARKNLKVEFSSSNDALKTFFDLYCITMKNLRADEFYFFPFTIFEDILRTLKDNIVIGIVKYNDIPISSSIFLFKYGFVHYWLSASNPQYRSFYPNNFLIFESMKWAKNMRNNKFILMGGTNKSLRAFKESFTNTKVGFYTINKIYNNEVFTQLNELRLSINTPNQKINFFPFYRT